MNKTRFLSFIFVTAIISLSILSCYSCSSDDEAPAIESVWRNMASEPIAQVNYAYPGQTLCLHGSGFSGLKRIIVNDTKIDVQNTLIYDTDNSITFQLPTDVNTSTEAKKYYIKVETSNGSTTYQPFHVKMLMEKPSITRFSATTLVGGTKLSITGTNLYGATDVYLPVAFNDKVRCEFDADNPNTSTTVNVVIPAEAHFAKGQAVIVMKKTDDIMQTSYEERVYSSVTNFQ